MKKNELRYENECVDILRKMTYLSGKLQDGVEVAVFRDNGWGDDPESGGSAYDIIMDGNGQISLGSMSKKCFDTLRYKGILEHNTLKTYKDRGYHRFLGGTL